MDPTTKILTWITVAVAIFFEIATSFFRAVISHQEQLSNLQSLYKVGGSTAIVRVCDEPPVQWLWVYTACRIEQRTEGVFLILTTYPELKLAEKMTKMGFRVQKSIPLSEL